MEPIQVARELVASTKRVLPKNGQTKDKTHSIFSIVETGAMPVVQWRTKKSSKLDDAPFDVTASSSTFTCNNHCQLDIHHHRHHSA